MAIYKNNYQVNDWVRVPKKYFYNWQNQRGYLLARITKIYPNKRYGLFVPNTGTLEIFSYRNIKPYLQ